jgi:hypothetical protein
MFRKPILLQLIVSLLAITLSACAASSPPANDSVFATVEASTEASTEAAPTATLPPEALTTETPIVADSATASVSYPIVDTGQTACYNNNEGISCPAKDQAFYGQDAQFGGEQPSYTLSADGLTVYDNVTGLTWTQSPDWNGDGTIDSDDKFTFDKAQAYPETLNAEQFGGYNDWRLPTIKELYSLMNFRGTDPIVTGNDTSGLIPFIDTDYFAFGYGDTAAGERIIDAQYWSSNAYVGSVMGNQSAIFGLNLADGRIKAYPRDLGRLGGTMTHFCLYARGNPEYGINDFVDNGDGTVTDEATGLMWSQDDSGVGMNWEDALGWVQQKNAENYLGHSDWRLPNAKEMQSLVDYSRAPDATNSAAIDPVFNITAISNEAGQLDYPWFWTGTTHLKFNGSAWDAVYIAFGRGLGSMDGVNVLDVHGAGCQRSDPKTGNANDYPTWGNGPQGDVRRVFNYVRLVRGGTTGDIFIGGEVEPSAGSPATPPGGDLRLEQPAGEPGQRPDLAAAAAQLGVSEEALRVALGDPRQGPPDFAAAAQQLGITEEELIAALGMPPAKQQPTRQLPPSTPTVTTTTSPASVEPTPAAGITRDACLNNTRDEAECKDCCDSLEGNGAARKACRDECPNHDFAQNTDFITMDVPSSLGPDGDYSACTAAGDERACKACCDDSTALQAGDRRFCRDACVAASGGDNQPAERKPDAPPQSPQMGQPREMTIDQALSDEAQRNTIAFDALAFLTGDLGADINPIRPS